MAELLLGFAKALELCKSSQGNKNQMPKEAHDCMKGCAPSCSDLQPSHAAPALCLLGLLSNIGSLHSPVINQNLVAATKKTCPPWATSATTQIKKSIIQAGASSGLSNLGAEQKHYETMKNESDKALGNNVHKPDQACFVASATIAGQGGLICKHQSGSAVLERSRSNDHAYFSASSIGDDHSRRWSWSGWEASPTAALRNFIEECEQRHESPLQMLHTSKEAERKDGGDQKGRVAMK